MDTAISRRKHVETYRYPHTVLLKGEAEQGMLASESQVWRGTGSKGSHDLARGLPYFEPLWCLRAC